MYRCLGFFAKPASFQILHWIEGVLVDPNKVMSKFRWCCSPSEHYTWSYDTPCICTIWDKRALRRWPPVKRIKFGRKEDLWLITPSWDSNWRPSSSTSYIICTCWFGVIYFCRWPVWLFVCNWDICTTKYTEGIKNIGIICGSGITWSKSKY